jgi:hypothetical protein
MHQNRYVFGERDRLMILRTISREVRIWQQIK